MKREREARGWTQEDVARRAGMTANHLSRIELGKSPPQRRTKRAIEAAFGVPEGWFERDQPPAPAPDEKDLVRQSVVYQRASQAVRDAFDRVEPFTSSAEPRDATWWTRRLVRLIDDERDGVLGEIPRGAVEIVRDDPEWKK